MPTADFALLLQHPMDARTAIGFAAGLMDVQDTFRQHLVLMATRTLRSLLPGIETAARHSIQTAHHRDREMRLLLGNESEDGRF